jgi:hypothetical protein
LLPKQYLDKDRSRPALTPNVGFARHKRQFKQGGIALQRRFAIAASAIRICGSLTAFSRTITNMALAHHLSHHSKPKNSNRGES